MKRINQFFAALKRDTHFYSLETKVLGDFFFPNRPLSSTLTTISEGQLPQCVLATDVQENLVLPSCPP